MNKTKFVHSLNSQGNLSHVETCDIFGEDLILDEHSHQITTGEELHEHVEESAVLEGRVKLDDPRTVGFGKNVAL